jgi:hypothetical protein
MDREQGMRALTQQGWLRTTPVEFQSAILSRYNWYQLEAGARITVGGEESGDLIGLAHGTVEMTTILGAAETPMMHLAHEVSWMRYGPIITGGPGEYRRTLDHLCGWPECLRARSWGCLANDRCGGGISCLLRSYTATLRSTSLRIS